MQPEAIDSLRGLRPRAWLCVGPGYSREDLKAELLRDPRGFVGDAVTSLIDVCAKIVGVSKDRMLSGPARQEVLRTLLAVQAIGGPLVELKRLRRQATFFRRLDRSLQAARLAFAHDEENEVYEERLVVRLGRNPVRLEVRKLALAYEIWLETEGYWDEPRLMRAAAQALGEGRTGGVVFPERILHLTTQTPESLEASVWDLLGRFVAVERLGPTRGSHPEMTSDAKSEGSSGGKSFLSDFPKEKSWEAWHTLDDAAESLADRLDWEQDVILIPDQPGVRRSLLRALAQRGIPLADPRDPTRLRWDEDVKWALLPLEVVARGFERESVLAWLRAYRFRTELPKWTKEITQRGIRLGLESYAGGDLGAVHTYLVSLGRALGGKRGCRELGEAHLAFLRAEIGEDGARAWLLEFFEATWRAFVEDTARVGQGDRVAAPLYWFERLNARLAEATPPVERLKAARGVRMYRLVQAPIGTYRRVWLFGLPADWLVADGAGDYWFTERDREVLSGEFSVRSGIQVRQERQAILAAWLSGTQEAHVLDAHYDWDGRERSSLWPVLRELGFSQEEVEPEEKGSHPRWSASYGSQRPFAPRSANLPSLAERGANEITASDIEAYTRCGFQALAGRRWKLDDVRQPEPELWGDVQGTILHEAVKILLEEELLIPVTEAVERAWQKKRPKGLLKGQRTERYAKTKLARVLETFVKAESEFVSRSGVSVFSLEGPKLRYDLGDFAITGVPDRVDEYRDGIVLYDYKSGGSLPNGAEMVDQGYRLQLPFYAVAARRQLEKPVHGLQFIELNRKGGRTKGIFFSAFNGKEEGKLTATTKVSKSLLDRMPDDVWAACEEQIESAARGYYTGRFEVKPRKDAECTTCRFSDVCGKRRFGDPFEGEEAAL